jgi:signal transduction histidine kinase
MLPRMEVDPERMERVLRNLLDNAIQYTPVHGVVTVEARRAGSRWIEITVSDTGAGIPPEDVGRIFERFYRADKGRERARGHSGLGLAIVKEIVEAHGGRVTVQSAVGEGTTFRFTVPQAAGLRAESEEPGSRESVRQAAT